MRGLLRERGLVQELFTQNVCNVPGKMSAHATHLLCLLSCDSPVASRSLHALLCTRALSKGSDVLGPAEVTLLCELVRLEDELWPQRLNLLIRVFLRGLEQLSSPGKAEAVVRPTLRVIVEIIRRSGTWEGHGDHAVETQVVAAG